MNKKICSFAFKATFKTQAGVYELPKCRKANINLQNFALVNKTLIIPHSKLLFLGWSTLGHRPTTIMFVLCARDRIHTAGQKGYYTTKHYYMASIAIQFT